MGSKHFLDDKSDVSKIENKRLKDSFEETNIKKSMSGGRTLAQKRLEKIRQQMKDNAKAKEIISLKNKEKNLASRNKDPVKSSTSPSKSKNPNSSSKDDISHSSKTVPFKNESPIVNKGRRRCEKSSVQGRIEKYQHDNKKEDFAISSQSKKVDKIKKETITSSIKLFMNKLSDKPSLINDDRNMKKANMHHSNVAKSREINKNNHPQTSCQTNPKVTKTSNAVCDVIHSKTVPQSNIKITNNDRIPSCQTNVVKFNATKLSNVISDTIQTNVSQSNVTNINNYKIPKCLNNLGNKEINGNSKININKTPHKRKLSNARDSKDIDGTVIRSVNLKRNLYKRKFVDSNANVNSVLTLNNMELKSNKKDDTKIIERKIPKKINTIKKVVMELNEINSTRKYDPGILIDNQSTTVNSNDDFVEDMEWEPVCEDFTLELKTVRNAVVNEDFIETMDWQESVLEIDKDPDDNIVHYVVDSNIFISSLKIVQKIQEDAGSIIVIPWQVLKELDCLKRGESKVATSSRRAVQYLLGCQSEHSSNVVWQTQQQANQDCPNFTVEIADDHIIKCCLQLSSSGHNVVLLSNDKNLRLKALVHKIASVSDEKLAEKMAFKTNKSEKLPLENQPKGTTELEIYAHKFTEVFKAFLNNVIQKYLKSVYGNMWAWYISEKLPISLLTLLDLIKNFSGKIFTNNECQKYIDQIDTFFKNQNYAKLTINELDGIVRICLRLAKLLPSDKNYTLEALQFEDNLAFLKARDCSSQIPYNDLCCKLTIQHFQQFESFLIGYCCKVAQVLGINFADSTLSDRPCTLPEKFNIDLIPHYMNILKIVINNLERISKIPPEQIFIHTKAIIPIYNTLVTYVEDRDTFFTIDDVVEFCKNDSVRSSLPEALVVFRCIKEFLDAAKNIACSKLI